MLKIPTGAPAQCMRPNIAGRHIGNRLAQVVVVVLALVASGCMAWSEDVRKLQVRGVVVDAETNKPLQGVGILVRYWERLTWWEKWMLTPEGRRKPRYGNSRGDPTDPEGKFAVDVRRSMREWERLGEETWPQEILFVQYYLCGYERSYQRVEDDHPFTDRETLLTFGEAQRVRMFRAQPGSRYHAEKC